jgi:hypothetical protein
MEIMNKQTKMGNQKGVGLIGIIVVLGVASYLLFQNSDILFKVAKQKKSTNELNISAKIFTNGLFNYTLYAVKERWCMDKVWGKDKACSSSSDMNNSLTNALNLERLLWSTPTENDIITRYKKIYGKNPPVAPRLDKVTHTLNVSDLDALGINHPLNLIVNENIKQCINKISIEIERQNPGVIKPQGDEVYLIITVKGLGDFSLFSKCDKNQKSMSLSGLVIIYPRTLNQFALIKAENLDVAGLKSTGAKGINFLGPVYVQGDLIIPDKGSYSVAFRDKVKIGEGLLKNGSNTFVPKSFGGKADTFLNQLSTLSGISNGIGLDGEIDGGLSKLFGGTYQYPKNTNMAACTNRQKLKEQFSLTKDSRVFIKGSAGLYRIGLSQSNELREYKIYGPDSKGFFVKDITDDRVTGANGSPKYNSYFGNQFNINYNVRTTSDYPVMEFVLELSSKTGNTTNDYNFSKILLGRDTELNIEFANKGFYAAKYAEINLPPTAYLDTNKLETMKLGPTEATKNLLSFYDKLKDECEDSVFKAANKPDLIGHKFCLKVINVGKADAVDCKADMDKKDEKDCEKAQARIEDAGKDYFDEELKIQEAIKVLSEAPPTLKIQTTTVLSNQNDVKFFFTNEANFGNPFLAHIEALKYRIDAFDFAIENSPNNTVYGLRTKAVMRPGPNEDVTFNQNAINFEIDRAFNGSFKKIVTKTDDNLEVDNKIQNNFSNWVLLRKNPMFMPADLSTYYPENGLSVADAKKLDEECAVDISAAAPPSWDISFTDTTQFSWLYNLTSSGISITDPSKTTPLPNYTFDASNNDMKVGFYSGVPTRSIVVTCTVKSNINFIFGFYVCENLVIEPRVTPLDIVGTFIVKNLTIDSSASNAGVNFYSIWHPGAIAILQANKHLRREYAVPPSGNTACDFKDLAGWNPKLTDDINGDFLSCSPAKFLYQGANNFNWTTVDPELGIESSAVGQATTQSKIVNRYRRFGINVVWQKEDYK